MPRIISNTATIMRRENAWSDNGKATVRICSDSPGEVSSEQFEAIREGRDPQSGDFLRQRKSADRVGSDGATQSRARNLYDFTISAPKSVSIMAMIGGDHRLIQAHQQAVAETLRELESHAAVRIRKNGANADRTTSNLVLAAYHHDTSRELDPQLHTHAVGANLSYDGTEDCWKALQASGIYERTAHLTEVYRNALARKVRELGYEIDNRHDAKGRDTGFEIRGIGEDLLAKYSQRSQQRDKAIQQFVLQTGREPTANEVAVLIRDSRAQKLIEISTAEVRKCQRDRLTSTESCGIDEVKSRCHRARAIDWEPAQVSLSYAKDHVFERVSVARQHDLLTEALRHGRGRIDHEELKGRLSLEESSGAILRDGNEVATVDRAVNICGAAGTGKTAIPRELHRALLEAGCDVLAIAPTMSAVEELQKVGFSNPLTVERLLQDPRSHSALAGKVLIVDEAGMISGRQMEGLLDLSITSSSRLVFCGDTKQIQSVEACDALRVLERESQLKTFRLTNVERAESVCVS